MNAKNKIKISPNLYVGRDGYAELSEKINSAIASKKKLLITYANANSVVLCEASKSTANCFNAFDIIHPDGTGIYFASRYLYGKKGLATRISGSDFYPILIKQIIKNSFSVFIFGDTESTLAGIADKQKELKIAGSHTGYGFDTSRIIESVNTSRPDLLIVGLGAPKQEEWIAKYAGLLDVPVILAIGEGLKVLAGTKIRGPKILRHLGLEWFARLLTSPAKFWRRYLLGIPNFMLIILKFKFKS